MTSFRPFVASQSEPPLPTMYDLPSENPEEPGLPDEFHDWQPQLLSQTFQPPAYPCDRVFTASDLNLYYDSLNTGLFKRPDWFAVVGVPRLVGSGRLSYVAWKEGRSPIVVVELLSPSTQEADQGQTLRGQQPPSKWEVYENILRVPYYVLFNREANIFRIFQLEGASYQELSEPNLWIKELQIGLGLWQGRFSGVERQWLRWHAANGEWIMTAEEDALQLAQRERKAREQAEQRAAQAEQKAAALAKRLQALGLDPDTEI
ncbi:Uma2 family endonuclease [Gloeobacter violaceus]|uniref:Glr1329 protein n=1 Tax=Gloeobacter violaceus (strain ATCC 29082 / PCC 7421) TaxID=251221 RepID=Q7NKZ7_GLOVI|nr:Uma2 family endonuclease [Gloeobacter violaceus]BAC89270.1 glr1329 [Gloeobacter violaceus PCC 7421]